MKESWREKEETRREHCSARWRERAHLNQMGRLYEKILAYSIGTRYSIYILPAVIILMIPVIVGTTQVSDDANKVPKIGGIRVVRFFTWIESVWLTY
jgi:hypothetical protein